MQSAHSNSKLLSALAHETHIWLARPQALIRAGRTADFLAQLNQAERDRYHKFVFDKDRYHFLSAHILVRTALSQYADISPQQWQFTCNNYGRPEIAGESNAPPLRFNLSHTNGLVVCVVTHEIDCGIDAEEIRPLSGYLSIARQMFTSDEYESLTLCPADRQYAAFFNYWTLKEAYIKARGLGLALATDGFQFSIDSSNEVSILFKEGLDDHHDAWQFQLMQLADKHAVALAIRPGRDKPRHVIRHRWLSDQAMQLIKAVSE